jgi:hypothetical protein
MSGIGDSIAHGDEKSAVKNTAPDNRTTRSTSDRTSITAVSWRSGGAAGATVKDFRASINASRESGVSGKKRGVPVIERQPSCRQDWRVASITFS